MRKYLIFFAFQFLAILSYGQFNLYNTRTLFDTFENPSQKSFYADSSRKIAFNFFIPTLSFNGTIQGPGQTPIKQLLYTGKTEPGKFNLGAGESNEVTLTENSYLFMLRIFKSVKFHREMGFAWQIRSDTYADITNETIAIFQNSKQFAARPYDNPFNSKGSNVNYHQFSFSYREDFNKRLGLGVKLSYLSGIAHNQLNIKSSSLTINPPNSYNLALNGLYRSNISWDDPQNDFIIPGIKNPGFAITLSTDYKLKGGWAVLGNLKDLGFIKWNKNEAYTYNYNDVITVDTRPNAPSKDRLTSQLQNLYDDGASRKSYITPVNSKAEVLLSKDLGSYQPHIFVSKNLFYRGGDIALVNRVKYRAMNFSLSTAYNLNNFFQLGGQFMLKSPNAEFFIGTDQFYKTYYTAKGAFSKNENIGKRSTAASMYFGFGLKFGRDMQRQQNSTNIPGMGDEKRGFFQRIFKRNKS
jgi:hypothetical protein